MKKFLKAIPICLILICSCFIMFACGQGEPIKFEIIDYITQASSNAIIKADGNTLTEDVNLPNGIQTIKVVALFEGWKGNVTVTPNDFYVVKNGTKYYGKYFVTGFRDDNSKTEILVTYSYGFNSNDDDTMQTINIAFGSSYSNLELVDTNKTDYKLYYKTTLVEEPTMHIC